MVPGTAIPALSSPITSGKHEPVAPATASGSGSSGRAPAGRADGTGRAQQQEGPPCTAPQGPSVPPWTAKPCPAPLSSLRTSPRSPSPAVLPLLCHGTGELPNLGLRVLSQSRGCTQIPAPAQPSEHRLCLQCAATWGG